MMRRRGLWNTAAKVGAQGMASTCYRLLRVVILALVLGGGGAVRADTPGATIEDAPAPSVNDIAEPADSPPPELQEIEVQGRRRHDKCNQQPLVDEIAEQVQSGLFEFSCRTVRWIDSLFGSNRDFPEENINGRVTFGFAWNEYEGFDPSLRYRVHMDLPNLSRRWDAFLGRVDEADYVAGAETSQESSLRRGLQDSSSTTGWLLGLGYKDREGKPSAWDFSFGVRLRTPPRVYVKTKYEWNRQFNSKLDLRYRQTFFWRDGSVGFGTTTHLDSARELSETNILRWEFIGRITEVTDGLSWWLGNTWYHRLGYQEGVSLRSFVRGETDRDVEITEYGFELTWRKPVGRDWLFINMGPTLTWPREHLHEKREASLGVQLLMELQFDYFRG